jgi:hypothetical protein
MMTMTDTDLAFAVRQRVMHRTSGCEALAYQYGWGADTAEARYDADTAALAETGVLPDLPPSPNISGAASAPVEPEPIHPSFYQAENVQDESDEDLLGTPDEGLDPLEGAQVEDDEPDPSAKSPKGQS